MTNCKVIKIIDENTIVINKGKNDNIKNGDKFLIYKLGEELIDPDTNESLGYLEIVCGEGRVTNAQERMSTVESSRRREVQAQRIIKKTGPLYFNTEEIVNPEYETIPFKNLEIGCFAKKI